MSNGTAELIIRRPQLGVCYYPEHWPENEWPDHARQMVQMGLSYVRIGEFAWSRLEPNPGQYEFDWLKRAIDVLSDAGLQIVLGTPTATPPKWLIDTMPDMIAIDQNGHKRGFGSRRHYDFSHAGYRAECTRIVTKIAEAFGKHPSVAVWQTDNEYGCHDTTYSYSAMALTGFRKWLQAKYRSIDNLNTAWGNVFWSMEYRDFSEIDLPNLTVTEANPSHHLAFRQYSSDQVVSFNREQVQILRRLSPGRDIVHNFMGMFTEFDHFDVAADLDISSWDSYPLGFLERRTDVSDAHKETYLNQGDPDFTAFHHDLYRGTGKGRWWVMEQQPGPVNWADWNPAPLPGMVRLWTWEAIAHGAEVVSYFRWRQAPFAQEQMHAGLNRPDGVPDIGAHEAANVANELGALALAVDTSAADIALVLDYQSIWMTQIQPQGKDFDPVSIHFAFYSAARKLGMSIDIVPADADLSDYKLVIVPNLLHVADSALSRFEATTAQMVFGPRTGSKTPDLSIPGNLAPGLLAQILPISVKCVESLRPGIVHQAGGHSISKWREHLDLLAEPDDCCKMPDGHSAWVRFDRLSYIAGWPDQGLLMDVLLKAATLAELPIQPMPEGLRVRTMGEHKIYTNYGKTPVELDAVIGSEAIILGEGHQIAPAGVLITRNS